MHVLVVNDDGPPSQQSSPYIHSFVHELQQAGVTVSVVLPHVQRSWIGKAHFVAKSLVPTYFRPGTLYTDDGTTHARPRRDGGEEWVLIDGTPASCAQIGINHYFQEKGPIDLVVSGPNYGRNSTALFCLSSGTVGGAMEGAVCGKRSIALSYAFFDRNHDPDIIRGASLLSVKLVKHLHDNWSPGVDMYSINVPLKEAIDSPETKIVYTNVLENRWMGSSFNEVEDDGPGGLDLGEREAEIREGAVSNDLQNEYVGLKHKKLIWAPRFADIHRSVDESSPGNDGWAIKMGHVSVTPLKANFMHFDGLQGEIKLCEGKFSIDSLNTHNELEVCYAVVDYEDNYVQPKIVEALENQIPGIIIAPSSAQVPPGAQRVLHWSAYESIDFEKVLLEVGSVICCSYMIRKALIRKHFLSRTISRHVAKYPDSVLSSAFPQTHDFELDYAEYLDEALAEEYDLAESLVRNDRAGAKDRVWWILKPGMSDRGQGIRLFSTEQELVDIFKSFEVAEDQDEEDSTEECNENLDTQVITNQLRFFVAQKYIHPPFLIDRRKFHIRTYVLAVGGLRVYVYKPMLALFAAKEYSPPWEGSTDLSGHLTNTCLQTDGASEGTVRLFWDLESNVPDGKDAMEGIWKSICAITGETFKAAATGQRIHFQVLPNVFEIFGLDFVLDADLRVYLLEVNSYPDFRQTGDELSPLIKGLFEGVAEIAVKPFMTGGRAGVEVGVEGFEKVLDVEAGYW